MPLIYSDWHEAGVVVVVVVVVKQILRPFVLIIWLGKLESVLLMRIRGVIEVLRVTSLLALTNYIELR